MRFPFDFRKYKQFFMAFGSVVAFIPLSLLIIMSGPTSAGRGWWVFFVLWLADLGLMFFAVYQLLDAMWQSERSSGQDHKRGTTSTDTQMPPTQYFKVATLTYEIADSRHPEVFAAFLDGLKPTQSDDSRLLVKSPTSSKTPAQQVRDEIAAWVKEFGYKYGDQVRIEYRITRNSLEVYLAIVATIGLIAQYHDLVESIILFDNQMQGTFGVMANTYQNQTGYTALVQQNAIITPSHLAQAQSPFASPSSQTMGVPSVPTYVAQPMPGNAININIGTPSTTYRGLGCAVFLLAVILLSILLVFVAGSIYCRFFDSAGFCADILYRLMW